MRVALPTHDGRISPVFDAAKRLLVVGVDGHGETGRHEAVVDQDDLIGRARYVADLGVDVLICGAISRPLEAGLASAGVRVISQTCGPIDEVLHAFLSGQLTNGAFRMPGCCGQGRRNRIAQEHR